MTELPSGTVTFLFTDIERSTQTVAALGNERYADVQDIHHKLLRQAFAAHHGVEVGTEGDAFFVAFTRPSDAIGAAIDGQRALSEHKWTDEVQLRVRMGIHTGEALVRDGDYIGHDVHKAKRISDAGHGGQILVSSATADLVADAFALRDLGLHRLKDLGEPQNLFQVCAPDLATAFPPLRSLETFRTNLPVARSALIGRGPELQAVRDALAANRIVTLTGIGGCGKTRLAQHVGAEELEAFEHGVYFVDLAPVTDPDAVPLAVAAAFSVASGGFGGGEIGRQLVEHLARRNMLLILDNCEHLLDDVAALADTILASCPDVKILATSREALEVEGEQAWRVPSLSLTPDDGDASSSEAVALFIARARAVDPSFSPSGADTAAITEVCRRLDGIPLAIELAAGRISHLSPRQIASRLDDMFRLLTGGRRRVQRQQTLHAALDWSYHLLDEAERSVLHRTAVFVGTFDLAAAESVCGDQGVHPERVVDIVGSLVGKSLVTPETADGETRYRLLETVRLYAEEKLRAAGEAEEVRTRHRDHYLHWLESLAPERVYFDPELVPVFHRELGNFRAAMEWSYQQQERGHLARIMQRIGSFLLNAGLHEEADAWALRSLEEPDAVSKQARADCKAFRAFAAQFRYDGSALVLAREAIDEAEGEGEVSVALAVSMFVMALNTAILAAATDSTELATEARAWWQRIFDLAEQSSTRPSGVLSYAWTYRTMTEMILGDLPAAATAARASLAAGEEEPYGLGRDASAIAQRNNLLAAAEHVMGNNEAAVRAAEKAYAAAFEQASVYGDSLIGELGGAAVAFAAAGDLQRAGEIGRRAIRVSREQSSLHRLSGSVIVAGCVAVHTGDLELASRLLAAGRWAGADQRSIPFGTADSFRLYQHHRDIVRASLPDAVARENRDRGKAMTLEDAAAEAEAFLNSDELSVDLA